MPTRSISAFLFAGLAFAAFAAPAAAQSAPAPPVATKIPVASTLHGDRRVDEYAWLRGKDKPEVLSYLQAENAYTTAMMKPTEALQQRLYDEMLGHIKQTDLSVPYRRGDYWYYTRTEAGKQYPLYARKRGSMDAPEEVMLDPNVLGGRQEVFRDRRRIAVSDDDTKLAYTFDETGYRQYTLAVKDLRTGTTLPDRAERVDQVVWASDNATLLYVTEDAVSKRSDTLWRRVLGADSVNVYREPDELYDVNLGRSSDRRIIFLTALSKTDDEVRYVDAARPADPLRTIVPRRANLRYFANHREGKFYFRTNLDAPNFRMVTAPDDAPGATDRVDGRDRVPAFGERRGLRRASRFHGDQRARKRARSARGARLRHRRPPPHRLRRTRLRSVRCHQPGVRAAHVAVLVPVAGDAADGDRVRSVRADAPACSSRPRYRATTARGTSWTACSRRRRTARRSRSP